MPAQQTSTSNAFRIRSSFSFFSAPGVGLKASEGNRASASFLSGIPARPRLITLPVYVSRTSACRIKDTGSGNCRPFPGYQGAGAISEEHKPLPVQAQHQGDLGDYGLACKEGLNGLSDFKTGFCVSLFFNHETGKILAVALIIRVRNGLTGDEVGNCAVDDMVRRGVDHSISPAGRGRLQYPVFTNKCEKPEDRISIQTDFSVFRLFPPPCQRGVHAFCLPRS